MCRMRHFRLVLDAAQKLLGESSGARLEEAEKLVSQLQKLAHRDEHKAKVRGPPSTSGPPPCTLLTASSLALLGLAGQVASMLGLCSINMGKRCGSRPLTAVLTVCAILLPTKHDSTADVWAFGQICSMTFMQHTQLMMGLVHSLAHQALAIPNAALHMQVLYIESYLRLRKANLPPDLAQLGPFEELSTAHKLALMKEAEIVVAKDQETVQGLLHDFLPAIIAYRWAVNSYAAAAHQLWRLLISCGLSEGDSAGPRHDCITCPSVVLGSCLIPLDLRHSAGRSLIRHLRCRKLMTDAAKLAGNEATKNSNHEWGMLFYSLAYLLNSHNLAALCNRANSYLMVSPSAVPGVPESQRPNLHVWRSQHTSAAHRRHWQASRRCNADLLV